MQVPGGSTQPFCVFPQASSASTPQSSVPSLPVTHLPSAHTQRGTSSVPTQQSGVATQRPDDSSHASDGSHKRAHSVVAESDDDDDRRPIPADRRGQVPGPARPVYTVATICKHPEAFPTRVLGVFADTADKREQYCGTYKAYCSDRYISLFPLLYWWVPLLPVMQRFAWQLEEGGKGRYWEGQRLNARRT